MLKKYNLQIETSLAIKPYLNENYIVHFKSINILLY